MNDDLEGLCDEGFGCIFAAFAVGAIAVAGIGVYGLRKAGVTGKQAWLGVLAAPVVYYGWKAVADSRRADRDAATRQIQAQASTPAPAPQPVAAQLNDFQLLDQLAMMGLQ